MRKYLKTEYGLLIHYPAPDFFDYDKKAYVPFPAGSRENGGIFFHTNPWAIIAETMLGRQENAFDYYKTILPCRRNDIAEICRTEPYVYSQTMLGKQHSRFGAAYNSWLSGTAAWTFVAGSQHILGIRPDFDSLIIDPCIPAEWDGITVEREFRGRTFIIEINNVSKKAERVKELKVNGITVSGNRVQLKNFIDAKVIRVTAEI